jgi:hypothetical protein
MDPSGANPLLSGRFLARVGSALILVFVVNTLFGLLPLQLLNPIWQIRVSDLLRTTAPFTLLGVALLYGSERSMAGSVQPPLNLHQIQKLAPLAALGFLLLIPLQANATWVQIRSADIEAQKTIRSVERRIAAVQAAASAPALQQLSLGLPEAWQPSPQLSVASNRKALLDRVQPELVRLRLSATTQKRQVIHKALQDLLRDTLISMIYGWAFFGLRLIRFTPVPSDPVGLGPIEPVTTAGKDPIDNSWF